MARTGIGVSVSSRQAILVPSDGSCTSFFVHCLDASTAWAEIQVKDLHATDEWIPVRPGRDIVFRLRHGPSGGISKVWARGGNGGTAMIDWGPVADTDRNDER